MCDARPLAMRCVPVQVVDGVAPVVLVVPAEGGEAHAHVHPGHLHAGDVGLDVRQDRVVQHGDVVQVPAGGHVLLAGGDTRSEQ